ncbi:hypothetical protein L1049_010221 [Liquidambar formosana]|uniref:J domain-containing protein n=1 Tax=Liquidambar formosana TaxID=63359 RepID=A0AAP0N9F5_LIQFO
MEPPPSLSHTNSNYSELSIMVIHLPLMSLRGRGRNPCVKSPSVQAFTATATASTTTFTRNSLENTLYQILGVEETASQTEMKAAYRHLAKLYHPDAHPKDQPQGAWDFIEIHKAYATLCDPIARARYDMSLAAAERFRNAAAANHHPGIGLRPSRRWETDQCW